ncbi:hypothetical protein [Ruminococcus albus]|nr:hypothetical protein [Ruminococcus albus]
MCGAIAAPDVRGERSDAVRQLKMFHVEHLFCNMESKKLPQTQQLFS